MAESTTSTFGSNSRVLSVGNPIIFGTSQGARTAITLAVSSTGPTLIAYLDADNDPIANPFGDGSTDIPFDNLATGADDLRAGYWIPVKAPPVR